ncbi:unnamed protein product [Caenorhabditis angaria]|uniref:Uncharacterized protein n=1 Tax=Caenorhabditis angaria TaxID=860376 RepID=A0A9P1IRS7_9PELO|nr:unnamed protein product [Caenorhabditis angaria]
MFLEKPLGNSILIILLAAQMTVMLYQNSHVQKSIVSRDTSFSSTRHFITWVSYGMTLLIFFKALRGHVAPVALAFQLYKLAAAVSLWYLADYEEEALPNSLQDPLKYMEVAKILIFFEISGFFLIWTHLYCKEFGDWEMEDSDQKKIEIEFFWKILCKRSQCV